MVDILVGSYRQENPTLQEFPTNQPPNYAHFARVLAVDLVENTIYLENTLGAQSSRYWMLNIDSFRQDWEEPEISASERPSAYSGVILEPVTRWAMTIDQSAFMSK